jgi:predicted DNA-binding ribbon-helix-helix protein
MPNGGQEDEKESSFQGIEPLKSQNFTIHGKRTSMRLEPTMWSALAEIAEREGMLVNDLFTLIKDRMEEQERRRQVALQAAGLPLPETRPAKEAKEGKDKKDSKDVTTLSSAVRVFITAYFRHACTDNSHHGAGHGQGNPFIGTPFEGLEGTDDGGKPPDSESSPSGGGGGGPPAGRSGRSRRGRGASNLAAVMVPPGRSG